MSKSLVSKYPLIDILETDDSAYAITDLDLKITWYNEGFKSLINTKRIKGKSLLQLLEFDDLEIARALDERAKSITVKPLWACSQILETVA